MSPFSYIGKDVAVVIDRPIGSRHPEYGWAYPVNYGYVAGTRSGDGEELDAYVLGISEPQERFDGTCVAVVVRHEQDDPKLIVVPCGLTLDDNAIASATKFQEQYFQSEILRAPPN